LTKRRIVVHTALKIIRKKSVHFADLDNQPEETQ
jgi:RNA polymerase sigma factor (sigma-70 family)